jgi:two-component system, LytTR family, sensor kinase
MLSPAVILLANRFRIEPPHWLRNILIHAFASIPFSTTAYFIWQVLAYSSGRMDLQLSLPNEMRLLAWGVVNGAPLYWVIVFVHDAGYYYKRYEISAARAADLNAQLAQAQLQSLKAQIHPHFLFNSLHSISELIHSDPSAAERMIVALSQLLRSSLSTCSLLEVPLGRELEVTQLYLDIEKMRFDERLVVEIQIGQDARDALVPNLILQPLVENAIKHGICRQPGIGRVDVEAARDGGRLVITIRDNGVGFDAGKQPIVEGVGLRTTRARLEQLYGSAQSFHFVRRAGNTEAVIRLPFKVVSTGVWTS